MKNISLKKYFIHSVFIFLGLMVATVSVAQKSKSANKSKADQAFLALDAAFVQQYQGNSTRIGEKIRPVILINGFTYTLYTANGKTVTFNDLVSPFNELKAVSHIGPALYAIGTLSWGNANGLDWKKVLATYQKKVQATINQVDQVDWSNAAWPNKGDQLKRFMHDALVLVDGFITKTLKKGSFTQADYSAFSTQYLHTMVATMRLSDIANTTYALQQLKKWKSQLGAKAWDQLFVVLMGSKGRTTSGLTIQTNTAALTVASLMKKHLVASHIIISPGSTTARQAFTILGTMMNARALARLTFSSPAAQKIDGLDAALKTSTKPLALDNVKSIILQSNKTGKVTLPYLGVTPPSR